MEFRPDSATIWIIDDESVYILNVHSKLCMYNIAMKECLYVALHTYNIMKNTYTQVS